MQGNKLRVQSAQVKELIDLAKKMVGWNVIFQIEGVKTKALGLYILTSNHRDKFRFNDGN